MTCWYMNSFISPQNLKTPQILYKYYKNVDFAIDAMENKRIHADIPNSYNDIYDCVYFVSREQFLHIEFERDFIISLVKKMINKYDANLLPAINADMRWSICKTFFDAIKYIDWNINEINVERYYTKIKDYINFGCLKQSDEYRVSCFTEKDNSLLMWSYYANSDRGLCLGFETSKDAGLFNNCFKVTYTDIFESNHNNISLFTKSMEWQHEKEWRIVVDKDTDYIKTPSLKSVCLGPRIMEREENLIIEKAIKNNLKVYYARPSINKYEIIVSEAKMKYEYF